VLASSPVPRAARPVRAAWLTAPLAAFVVTFFAAAWLGCGGAESGGSGLYTVRGVVEEVHQEYQQVVVDHEDIPGFMPAMTMNFDVADPALLAELAPGQRIEFELEFTGRSFRILEARVIGQAEGRAARLGIAGAVREEQPAPEFALVDQEGRELSLADLRGKVVLLDFIYTTCPGPCPILTSIQVRAQRALAPEVRERVHFVSITLDPERDTPDALRQYAEARGADLASWSFLTGETGTVADVIARYGVGSVRRPDGEIDHLVVTFLIDEEGGIVKRYVGLEHAAEDVARDVSALASS
jgi:protein SCO1